MRLSDMARNMLGINQLLSQYAMQAQTPAEKERVIAMAHAFQSACLQSIENMDRVISTIHVESEIARQEDLAEFTDSVMQDLLDLPTTEG